MPGISIAKLKLIPFRPYWGWIWMAGQRYSDLSRQWILQMLHPEGSTQNTLGNILIFKGKETDLHGLPKYLPNIIIIGKELSVPNSPQSADRFNFRLIREGVKVLWHLRLRCCLWQGWSGISLKEERDSIVALMMEILESDIYPFIAFSSSRTRQTGHWTISLVRLQEMRWIEYNSVPYQSLFLYWGRTVWVNT